MPDQRFNLGWFPDAEESDAQEGACLRADNCVVTAAGVLRPRPGKAKINQSALADTSVNSLFTVRRSGTKRRLVGAGNNVYLDGISTGTDIAGSGDIQFGAHMGQVLYARSTDHLKHDGTTERTWGIAAPSAAPVLSALAADLKTFASCDSSESPGFTANEGSVAFAADRAGTANSAAALTPDATTGRGTMTLTYAAPTDFTSYDGGQTGVGSDLFDFYALITEPQNVSGIQVLVDVNDGTFEEDYYGYTFRPGEDESFQLSPEESVSEDFLLEGWLQKDFFQRQGTVPQLETKIREDTASGWSHFTVPRARFQRTGGTSGKNWSTVKAVRVAFVATVGGAASIIRFDEITIRGGAERTLTGRYVAKIVPVYNNGTYSAVGVASAASAEIEVKTNGIRATVASGVIAALDSQVTELWLFLFGGRLDQYYRFAVLDGGPFTGEQTIDAEISDVAAIIANITLQNDNAVPPDDITGIAGPHYDRVFCLTEHFLYPSKPLNPDSFSAGEVVRVGDETETALWIIKNAEQLYVGTTRDVYRFDGDWTVQPDTTVNVFKRPMGVAFPPVSAAHAHGRIDGQDAIVYLTGQGWKILGGPLLTGPETGVSRLWAGEARHSVSAPNITSESARFRATLARNRLICLTPEGSSTTSSQVLHVYDFSLGKWFRWTFSVSLLSLLTEYDGTVLLGDASGFSSALSGTDAADDGTDFTMTVWTPNLDLGVALHGWGRRGYPKLTGSGSVTVTPVFRGAAQAAMAVTVSASDTRPEVRLGREAHGKEIRWILSATGDMALHGVMSEIAGVA